ncbi:MAG TPA: hypothetical protein VF763_00540 [Candidatus Limnocylindrales bacterium]
MFLTTRVLIGVIAAFIFLGGVAGTILGGPAFAPAGFPALLTGGVLLLAVLLERGRYRSQAAEAASESSGPGGGETQALEPRFQRTQEVFRDPTTGRRMRVYLDHRTGDRRYVAED